MYSSRTSYRDSETVEVRERRHGEQQPDISGAKCLRFFGLRASQATPMLTQSTAEEIVFYNCYWDTTASIPQSSCAEVREVRLVETGIDEFGFNEILCNCPNLRSLVYYRPSDETDTWLDLMGKELAQHGQNLEHLVLMNESLMPFSTPFKSLHTLVNLKTLVVGLELLIGFLDNPRNWDDYEDGFDPEEEESDDDEIDEYVGLWSLVEMLPPSLEELTIDIEVPKLEVYYNTYERYGAKFEELLTDSRFENLRCVEAPHLAEMAEKLSVKSAGWAFVESECWTLARTPPRAKAKTEASSSSEADTQEVDTETIA